MRLTFLHANGVLKGNVTLGNRIHMSIEKGKMKSVVNACIIGGLLNDHEDRLMMGLGIHLEIDFSMCLCICLLLTLYAYAHTHTQTHPRINLPNPSL